MAVLVVRVRQRTDETFRVEVGTGLTELGDTLGAGPIVTERVAHGHRVRPLPHPRRSPKPK